MAKAVRKNVKVVRERRPKPVEAELATLDAAQSMILIVRGERVILDTDLAALYGVTTRRFNEQVGRNLDRFPPDFMFRLNSVEKHELVANCDRFRNLRHSSTPPRAFTEHGAIMAATVLSSPRAVVASVAVVRAFVRLRHILASHADLAKRLAELESKYDDQFAVVFDAIRALMDPPDEPDPSKPAIGFER